jgi:hypothetical protein
MLLIGLADGTTVSPAYFRCVLIVKRGLRPLKTSLKFLLDVAPLCGPFTSY